MASTPSGRGASSPRRRWVGSGGQRSSLAWCASSAAMRRPSSRARSSPWTVASASSAEYEHSTLHRRRAPSDASRHKPVPHSMKIVDIRATPVTVPLEAPLRHSNGAHWGRFVRTIVEVEADNGLVGLGEMGGGGESAEAAFRALKAYLVGHDPFELEALRLMIANPTASLYNNRTQLLAAIEFACLDLVGQKWGVPVSEMLGGRLRERVPFAS